VIENHRHVPTKTLVVALDSDRKCAMKGPGRPILSFIERAAALAYMPVDYIVEIDTERDMYDLVKYLSPDLRVQGPDYLNRPTRFPYIRRCIVKDYSGMRTSEIIRRCKLVK
jgi:bifunctional ADP-heptose synthase (sugar kinase/adenylyltransferase)